MLNKGPNVPPAVASGLICLVIGGAIGVNFRDEHTKTTDKSPNMRLSSPPAGSGGPGGAQTPTASADLTRLVRGLSTVQSVQNKGLTAQQAASLKPILAAIQSADKLPEAECKTRLDTINSLLTAEQKETLASLQPARGGGGGGMGKMGGGPGAGGPGGGMGGSGGGMGKMGGGAPPDPDKPFASERNKKALDDLVTALGSVK